MFHSRNFYFPFDITSTDRTTPYITVNTFPREIYQIVTIASGTKPGGKSHGQDRVEGLGQNELVNLYYASVSNDSVAAKAPALASASLKPNVIMLQ